MHGPTGEMYCKIKNIKNTVFSPTISIKEDKTEILVAT
jgi:hypothetical protein